MYIIKKLTSIILVAIAIILPTGCSVTIENTTEPTTLTTFPADDTSINVIENSFAQEIFNLVNEYRKTNGVPVLCYNKKLEPIATVRAEEARLQWSHTRPDGRAYYTAFIESGYEARFVGENLARGMGDAQTIFSAWLESETHKSNILNDKFTQTAISIYKDELGKRYIAEEFSS